MNGEDATKSGLLERLKEIQNVADRYHGVAELEPLLVDLLTFLQTEGIDRTCAEQMLGALSRDWPPGSVEAVEFTMRTLQWPGIRVSLEKQLEGNADFRIKEQTKRVLEVFACAWPAGEIYTTYRHSR